MKGGVFDWVRRCTEIILTAKHHDCTLWTVTRITVIIQESRFQRKHLFDHQIDLLTTILIITLQWFSLFSYQFPPKMKNQNPLKISKNYLHNKYYFAFSRNSAEEQHEEFWHNVVAILQCDYKTTKKTCMMWVCFAIKYVSTEYFVSSSVSHWVWDWTEIDTERLHSRQQHCM